MYVIYPSYDLFLAQRLVEVKALLHFPTGLAVQSEGAEPDPVDILPSQEAIKAADEDRSGWARLRGRAEVWWCVLRMTPATAGVQTCEGKIAAELQRPATGYWSSQTDLANWEGREVTQRPLLAADVDSQGLLFISRNGECPNIHQIQCVSVWFLI